MDSEWTIERYVHRIQHTPMQPPAPPPLRSLLHAACSILCPSLQCPHPMQPPHLFTRGTRFLSAYLSITYVGLPPCSPPLTLTPMQATAPPPLPPLLHAVICSLSAPLLMQCHSSPPCGAHSICWPSPRHLWANPLAAKRPACCFSPTMSIHR